MTIALLYTVYGDLLRNHTKKIATDASSVHRRVSEAIGTQ